MVRDTIQEIHVIGSLLSLSIHKNRCVREELSFLVGKVPLEGLSRP